MLRAVGRRFEAFFRATTPDPFVLAVGLTALVFVLAMLIEGTAPLDVVRAWQGDAGFFSLLAFTMQMALILVTGHALAATPPVRRLIERIAEMPRSARTAPALVAFVAIGCALVNWGLGLIVGALLAREVGRSCAARGLRAHYPLLVAAGYSGMMCWHGGLSGTAPLMMTTRSDVERFLGPELSAGVELVPFTDSVLGTGNLIVTGGLWLLVPVLAMFLAPNDEHADPGPFERAEPARAGDAAHDGGARIRLALAAIAVVALGAAWLHRGDAIVDLLARAGRAVGLTSSVLIGLAAVGAPLAAVAFALRNPSGERAARLPERIERSPWTMALATVPLVAAVGLWFDEVGVSALEPNAINLMFLTLGLLLSGSLAAYAAYVGAATSGAAGILLQFPFYAGIMGVMRTTGLARDVSAWLVGHAPAELYTLVTFLSAGLVNLFVPSGGGQWAVQGPIAVSAAQDLGIPVEHVVMAVAYGDQWTNMLQPFWALPLLAITGAKARDIMGYTTLFLIVGGLWIGLCLVAQG